MINIVNPLIFRAKCFPFYKNKINVYYNNNFNVCLLFSKFKLFISTKSNIIFANIFSGNKCAFLYVSDHYKNSNICFTNLSKQEILSYKFYKKIVVFKFPSLFNTVELIIFFILKRLLISTINIRKELFQLIFLLINEYNLMGVKCILSGRIKGVQRARRESIKVGHNSMTNSFNYVKYCSSYILTKYGKLGIKLWLFI